MILDHNKKTLIISLASLYFFKNDFSALKT